MVVVKLTGVAARFGLYESFRHFRCFRRYKKYSKDV